MAQPTSQASPERVQTHSTLTCPRCGYALELEMPLDSCLFFHKCAGCGELMSPLPGDCCGGGCAQCVFDLYQRELELWQRRVDEIQEHAKDFHRRER